VCELRLEDVNRQLGLSQLYGPLQLTNLMESRTAPIHEDRGCPPSSTEGLANVKRSAMMTLNATVSRRRWK